MKLRKFIFLSLPLIIVFFVFGITSTSQTLAASSSSILASVVPENPAPNENVTVTLSSYAENLDNVSITWLVNNKKVSSGIGKKSFLINAPAAGSETSITAQIALKDGEVETKVIIRPSVMVLLWQASDSYVPPFYKGKALPSPESKIKVIAMPEIKNGSKMVDSTNLVYAWKQDYTNDQDNSGYSKNFFSYLNDYLDNSNNISVTASTLDDKYSSTASLDIGTVQPKILFYKNDKNLGTIWEQTLADPHKIQNNETIVAIPYFISPKEIQNPRLEWNWSINDNIVNIQDFRKNFMPLRVPAGTSGTSKVRLEINNIDKIFETADKEINIEF